MTSAQLGLKPGPLGEAYLVPYGEQVTFIPGYRHLLELVELRAARTRLRPRRT